MRIFSVLHPRPICSKFNDVVSQHDIKIYIKISIFKYGKCIDIFCYSHFFSKNINVFEKILDTAC